MPYECRTLESLVIPLQLLSPNTVDTEKIWEREKSAKKSIISFINYFFPALISSAAMNLLHLSFHDLPNHPSVTCVRKKNTETFFFKVKARESHINAKKHIMDLCRVFGIFCNRFHVDRQATNQDRTHNTQQKEILIAPLFVMSTQPRPFNDLSLAPTVIALLMGKIFKWLGILLVSLVLCEYFLLLCLLYRSSSSVFFYILLSSCALCHPLCSASVRRESVFATDLSKRGSNRSFSRYTLLT